MKFNSTDLQDAFEKARPVLDQLNDTKNIISTEIKALEKYFQNIHLGDDLTYRIQDPCQTTSFIDCDIGEYCLSGWAVTGEELLIWDNQQKRLIYQCNQYDADVDLDSNLPVKVNKDSCREVTRKPLIECKFDIRKRIYEEHLSKFLQMITEKFTLQPKEEPALLDIPF